MKKSILRLAMASIAAMLSVSISFAADGTPTPGEGGGDEPATGSGVVDVLNGTQSHSWLPSYPNGTYSMSQQIYTAAEIGQAGMITSVAFYNYEMGSERLYDIYLTHTEKTSFDSTTDWVAVSEKDKVFTGLVTLASGWTVIDFDTPFVYDGTQNLLLTVDDNTGKDTGFNFSIASTNGSSNQTLYYYMYSGAANLDPTQAITTEGRLTTSRNNLQLCFETYPKPYRLETVEVGDVSAQIQCTLRGDATAWNLRYRKVAGEGEEEQRWTQVDGLGRSYTIEDLTPATKYEAQAQGVFAEENVSDWTESLLFTTNCCPVEEQAELIFALNSRYYTYWNNFAVQIVDVTDEAHPFEAAYLHSPLQGLFGGTVTLCCGHNYKVNWIHDAGHANNSDDLSFALYFEPGDEIFSMAYGEAPAETAELTTFVMDCTPYCAPKPKNISVTGTTYNSATLSFTSETSAGEVVYSTEADFDPETASPTSVNFDALSVSNDPWGGNPANSSLTLTGLEPLTEYYVSVRSVCTEGEGGISRWSDPVKVTTGSRFDAPTQVTAKAVNSHTEDLSWGSRGNEKAYNLYYRPQAAGTPVDPSAVATFGGGNGKGFEDWSGIWASYGDRPFSNVLYVSGVAAGSSFGFGAANGKTGSQNTIAILYGMRRLTEETPEIQMRKFDEKCLNDADREWRIAEMKQKVKEIKDQINKLIEDHDNGVITDEEWNQQYPPLSSEKMKCEDELQYLSNLPTDAVKLVRMKELEQNIQNAQSTLASGTVDPSSELYQTLQAELRADQAELNELRALTSEAAGGSHNGSGFSITTEKQSPAQARGFRTPENETYVFFIRHANNDGMLWINNLTITPPELVNEWICIPNVKGTSYTLVDLEPNTAYEVMVEPVYEGGVTGTQSPITVFTTLSEDTDPILADFSVSATKKVNFSKGNLRFEGDNDGMEAEWSIAPQQYTTLGEDNVNVQSSGSTYPAYLKDLLCWSTTKNNYGIYNYYYDSEEYGEPYFKGDFVDWGTNPTLIANLGSGWSTLSKDEWDYLLNERENAAQLMALATVADVKGLILLPDEWDTSTSILQSYTAEEWAVVEASGAVFLPIAGQMSAVYNPDTYGAVTTFTAVGVYWTSSPALDGSSVEDADRYAAGLTIGETEVTFANVSRRTYNAVRLVKEVAGSGEPTGISDASHLNDKGKMINDSWYDLQGRKIKSQISNLKSQIKKGLYIRNGRKVVIR